MVVEGSGSYGIVVSSPRIPVGDESYLEILNLEEVSKLFLLKKNKDYMPGSFEDFTKEFNGIQELSEKYPNIFTNNYFMLPIKGGQIDKYKFVEKFNENIHYNIKWLNNSNKYFKIINDLVKNNEPIYQIVYQQGKKIKLNWNEFDEKIFNILEALKLSNSNGFYFDDLKIENLIYHDDKIKIIDFSQPINTNESFDNIVKQIIDSKLNTIYYFPFNTICNILLYENLNILKYIGGPNKNNDYYPILYLNRIEFNNNVNYKYNIIINYINLLKKYIPEYKTNLNLINFNLSNRLKNENLQTKNELKKFYINKEINIDIIKNGLINLLNFNLNNSNNYYDCDYDYDYDWEIINSNNFASQSNKIINGYKRFINLIYKDKIHMINFLLESINIYSFGFMYIEWLSKNINTLIESINIKNILNRITNIVVMCCLNVISIDSELYIVEFPNYDKII